MADVQDGPVLNIGARADLDGIDVAAGDDHRPQRCILTDGDITDHHGAVIHIGACRDARADPLKASYSHRANLPVHCTFLQAIDSGLAG